MIAPSTVLVFGPESVSYERYPLIDRWVLREISARVFFVKITKIDTSHISNISRILGIMETSISNISRILGSIFRLRGPVNIAFRTDSAQFQLKTHIFYINSVTKKVPVEDI